MNLLYVLNRISVGANRSLMRNGRNYNWIQFPFQKAPSVKWWFYHNLYRRYMLPWGIPKGEYPRFLTNWSRHLDHPRNVLSLRPWRKNVR